MTHSLVVEFPRVQRVLLTVAFTPVVLTSFGFAVGAPPLVGLGIFAPQMAVLTYMLVRILRIRWTAQEDGLVFEGYLWRWHFPREAIAEIVVDRPANFVRIVDATGVGRSIPQGTSQPTKRS